MTRRLATLAIAACGALSGCASAPVPAADASPAARIYAPQITHPHPDTAQVTVVRDSGVAGSACNDLLFVDGQKVAALSTSQKVTLYLSPGHHVLGTTASGICAGGSASVEMTLRAGDMRDYRIGSHQSGDLFIQPSAF